MPSLRMKNKSSICCLREKNGLHICKKSTIRAKRSCSHLKISQLAAEAGNCCQSCEGVSTNCELNILDTGAIGATNSGELFGGEDVQFKQPPTFPDDCAVIKGMELPIVSFSANLEAIFSSSHSDVRDVLSSYDNAGSNIGEDPFLLGSADESDGNSGSSSDHQTCNISDFFISDMALTGLPIDGSSLCDDIAVALMFPEHDTAESNIFFDDTDEHITLPFVDKSSEKVDVRGSGEARLNCDSSSFSFAIHQIRPGDPEPRACVELDETQYLDPQSFIRNLPDLTDMPNERPSIFPKESGESKPITLVLDLDETLVHSTLEHCEDADFTFTVFFNMKDHAVYVKERPHLRAFLKKVASMFEVVVFTASKSIYAEQLLDILDPDGNLIAGRAYRESCFFSNGIYIKDLTVLGFDLANVVIIDNSPQVFQLQINNGIPIKSWFDDPSDNELISLIPFLETLANADDVRPLIAKRFGNKE